MPFVKHASILKCMFLMQVLNGDGVKLGDTKLILPTTKFISTIIFWLYGMLYS